MIPSPNIWNSPDAYELENRGCDPERVIEAAIGRLHPWRDAVVVDVGAGSGFHLPRFVELGAARAIGIEPYAPLVARARERISHCEASVRDRIEVLDGSAEELPLLDASADVLHARWAYFFGPGSEPGIAEAKRVVRPGGVIAIIDNDTERSTFGRWFAQTHPGWDPRALQRFWARHGFAREPLMIQWRHESREDFETVVRLEFAPQDADRFLAEYAENWVDYAVNLWWWRREP